MARGSEFLDYLWDAELQQLMLMACPDGVLVADPEERIVLYTGACEQLFGYTPTEAIGKPIAAIFGNRGADLELRDQVRAEGKVTNLELKALRKGAHPFWAAVSASVLRDRYGGLLGTVYYVRDHSDIREIESNLRATNDQLNQMVDRLHHVASHDGLTGLLNRASALRQAEESFSEHEALGVVVMDLDHFKEVNDTFGHLAGDQVLTTVAKTVQDAARSGDIVGRFGGEEFVAFLPSADLPATAAFAERTRQLVSLKPIAVDEESTQTVTISAGAASIPEDAATIAEAIHVADRRLYAAKRAGRNRVVADDHEQLASRSAA